MRISALLALWLAPAAALADCPTAADLGQGVRLISSEGEAETFRLRDDGIFEVLNYYEPGEGTKYTLAKGVYVIQFQEIAGGLALPDGTTFYTYDLDPDEMPDPVPGGGWDVEAELTGAGGGVDTEAQSYRFGEVTSMTIGACTYDMIPIEARYGTSTDGFRDRYFYLPELGFSFIAESGPLDGPADYQASYIRIEAVQ